MSSPRAKAPWGQKLLLAVGVSASPLQALVHPEACCVFCRVLQPQPSARLARATVHQRTPATVSYLLPETEDLGKAYLAPLLVHLPPRHTDNADSSSSCVVVSKLRALLVDRRIRESGPRPGVRAFPLRHTRRAIPRTSSLRPPSPLSYPHHLVSPAVPKALHIFNARPRE